MHRQRLYGYSLIECLVVIAIASIVLALCIGGFSSVVQKSRQNNALQALLHTLDRGRTLASVRGQRVALCIMNADEACSEEWRGNYLMVFVDSNKNQQRDNDEEIFYRQPWELSQIALSWNRPYSSIAFQPDGSAVLNGTLTLADQEGTVFKSLKISKVGRTRIE